MITRRDLILGGGMITAAGAAYALTPRERLILLGNAKLEAIVPKTIGNWVNVPSDAFVLPKTKGSLADTLYSQQLSRLYQSPDNVPVMLVMAYGNYQSDLLQLHRPETCYAAVGFQISSSDVGQVVLGPDAKLPVRELTATSDSRIEPIVYWTRIGDLLPTDGNQQRWMKLRQAFDGWIPDGILVRISTVGPGSPDIFAALRGFATALVLSIPPADRAALIGRPLAARMA